MGEMKVFDPSLPPVFDVYDDDIVDQGIPQLGHVGTLMIPKIMPKGIVAGGQEIAVKRLSKGSCQGGKESKNEVALLANLHHTHIINVLLDLEMNPKIADFGTTRMCGAEQTHIDSSKVVETQGYITLEYLYQGPFSVKLDAYNSGAHGQEHIQLVFDPGGLHRSKNRDDSF